MLILLLYSHKSSYNKFTEASFKPPRALNDTTLTQLTGSFNFTVTENQKESFKTKIHGKYLQNLISNLEDRFSDSGVLSALANIFNSQKAMCCPSDQFNNYGDGEIATISAHFTTTVAKDILLQEWSCFKHLLIAEFKCIHVILCQHYQLTLPFPLCIPLYLS